MRRSEIIEVLNDSIDDSFEDDVAGAFDRNDLDNVARQLQDRDADRNEIERLVEKVATGASGRELDALADGDMDNPNAWLYARLRDA